MAATYLGEPALAATPVSPAPRRAPGHGAWGHEPLAGAQVRYLVVTPTRVVIFALDRDVRGPLLYRLLRVEIERSRDDVRGVVLGHPRFSRPLVVVLRDGVRWDLEVSLTGSRAWGPVVDELGRMPDEAPAPLPAPDHPA